LTIFTVQFSNLAKLEVDLPVSDQLAHLVHRSRSSLERITAVNQRQRPHDRRKVQRPVKRRVTTADDNNVFATEVLDTAHRIENRRVLILLDAFDRWALRLERTAAGSNHHNLGVEDFI